MSKTILVVGDVMMDVIVSLQQEMQRGSDAPSTIATTFGGVGANVSAWIGHQGIPCRLISVIGADPWGQLMEKHLQSLGVETRFEHNASVPTGIVVALSHPDGERSMFPDSRANQLLSHTQFSDEVWENVSWLSMSGYTLLHPQTRELAVHLMRTAKQRDVKVALDPASSAPLSDVSVAELHQWFAHVDVLLPNEQELQVLAPHAEWQESLRALAKLVPTVIAKRGEHGSAICHNGTITEIAAIATKVIDTVGAGDAYAAGTIAALSRGEDVVTAAENGARVATLALNTRGAQPASRLP